jgi:RNA polymerase sigma factor (sigma-70 family)
MRAKPLEKVKDNPHLGPLDTFFSENYRIVHKVAQVYAARARALGFDYDDIVNEGVIGFLKAYSLYDPTAFVGLDGEGVKFSTYAVPKIHGEIKRFFRDHNVGVKFSRSDKEAAAKIRKMEAKEPGFIQRPAEEIAEIIDTKVTVVKRAIVLLTQSATESLQSVVFESDGGDPITLEDQVASEEDHTAIHVEEFLNKLPQKLATIVRMRMLGKTQNEIGEAIGVSQVQVSRLMEKIEEITQYWFAGKPIDWLLGYDKGEEPQQIRPPKGNQAKVVVLLKEGKLTQQEIVRATGCSTKTVSKLAKELQERGELPLEYSKKRRKKKGGDQKWQSLGSVPSVEAPTSHRTEKRPSAASVRVSA